MIQQPCEICETPVPLKQILMEDSLAWICQRCWESMLEKAGDE